jgi:hypothetical protein
MRITAIAAAVGSSTRASVSVCTQQRVARRRVRQRMRPGQQRAAGGVQSEEEQTAQA